MKTLLCATLAGLLGAGPLSAETLMQDLKQADTIGARSRSAGDEGARFLGEDSFNHLMGALSGARDGSSAAVSASSSRRRAFTVQSLPRPKLDATDRSAAVPAASADWNPAVKGWDGFSAGFWKGFDLVETPATSILNAGMKDCDHEYCVPDPSLSAKATGFAAGVVLAAPAAVAGAATGLFGALFGIRKY